MSYAFSEEQGLIQQVAREFAQEYVSPLAADMDKNDTHPQALFEQMGEHDFLGLFIPSEYGGADSDYISFMLIIEELSRISGAVGSILINHSALAMYAINRWGTPAQKQKYLSAMCKGESLGAFGLSEPGAAPGAGPEKLTAVKQGDIYILNGRKSYVFNGGEAGIYVIAASTDPEAGLKGMSLFIVDDETAGFSIGNKIQKMGLRGCQSTEIIFDNVQLPPEAILGQENQAETMLKELLAVRNIVQGAQVAGIVQAALDDAVQYAKQRIQFRRPIASFPAVQDMLVGIATNLHLTRLAVYHAAKLMDEGESYAAEAAMIQYFTQLIGQNALIEAIQVEGGYGYSQDMLVSRLYRDIKGATIIDSSFDFPVKTIAADLLA